MLIGPFLLMAAGMQLTIMSYSRDRNIRTMRQVLFYTGCLMFGFALGLASVSVLDV